MSGFYRFGAPGDDTMAHLNTGRKFCDRCKMPRFDKDNPKLGRLCQRMAPTLCDAPKCDIPICELHRVKHPTKANTDYCLDHKQLVEA